VVTTGPEWLETSTTATGSGPRWSDMNPGEDRWRSGCLHRAADARPAGRPPTRLPVPGSLHAAVFEPRAAVPYTSPG
jgi:hypothetical protein